MAASDKKKTTRTSKVTVHRYSNPANVEGWTGWVEDEAKRWILYFDDEGRTRYYPRRDSETGGVLDDGTLPHWATSANAEIVARAVLQVGGSRERAASAYRSTLFGLGEPASAIDTEHMLRAWQSAIASSGPVLIRAGMPDPSHAVTHAPIVDKSPLIRLALLAVEYGVSPERMTFALPDDFRYSEDVPENERVFPPAPVAAFTSGEAGSRTTDILCPRVSFSWCDLNGRHFPDWVGFGGELVALHDINEIITDKGGRFDRDRPDHLAVARAILEHFKVMGYTCAAARVAEVLAGRDDPGPA